MWRLIFRLLLLCLCSTTGLAGPLKIVVVGDSTVSSYPAEDQLVGWGQLLKSYFNETVTVINCARPGASTKTFVNENRWADALKERPDVILIQFGHNDENIGPGRTQPEGEYSENLRFMVDTARHAKTTPILVTPMHRRTFKHDVLSDDGLAPYANAMEQVAKKKHAFLVELYTSSALFFSRLGEEGCKTLGPPNDFTHFNMKGAKEMSAQVIKGLMTIEPRLATRLASPSAE